MAIKIFNATETEYIGTASADLVLGNSLDNFIDGGEGNNVIFGLDGNDIILTGSGDDVILGGDGDDVLEAGAGDNVLSGGNGNDIIVAQEGDDLIWGGNGDDQIYGGDGDNLIFGGNGNDFITTGEGDDILYGGAGNDQIDGGDGDDILDGGDGQDLLLGQDSTAGDETVVGDLFHVTSDDTLLGGEGNDSFRVGNAFEGLTTITGGTSELDNAGEEALYVEVGDDEETGELVGINSATGLVEAITTRTQAEQSETDVRLNIVTRPGSTALSTFATSIAGYNAVDTIEFTKSGDFSESLEFSGIERIELASGVNITLSAEQIIDNGESLDRGFINPGVHFYGVAGGATESVTVVVDYDDVTFTPAASVVGGTATTYEFGDFQLDDFSVADLFHDVKAIYDANTNSEEDSYVRIDGSNNSETVYGSEGVDNATMRLGDDTYYGYGGNDLIVGHGGADYLDGGEGDDIFLIGGFGSGVQGTTSKADDGNKEWIATGAKHDVIVGGDGVDTLRITTGIGANTQANGTVVLNNDNFKSMEVVQVGGTVGRINTEDSALQLINDHYYFAANGTVANLSDTLGNNGGTINNVVVDASGLTTNGLRFEGNGNNQTFIGTSKADVFVGNGGNDTLTGGAGADTFVFGKVHQEVVTGASNTVQTYVDTAFNLTGTDTITDFKHGTDKLELHLDQYTNLSGFTAANLISNATGTAADANDYLVFNTTSKLLTYDADGNGAGAAVNIAVLTGVTTLTASDFVIA
jgi:Ca2+-binding RTX toxin-like protein